MKKHLFLIILFLGISQLYAQSKWTKGAVLSLGFSGQQQQDIKNSNIYARDDESKLMPSFGGGLWMERSLSNHFKLETGLNYGYLQHFNRSKNTYYSNLGRVKKIIQEDHKNKLHQLYVPLQLYYVFKNSDSEVRPYLMIGGQVSYSLSLTQSEVTSSVGINSNSIYIHEEKYYANKNDNLINQQPLSFSFGWGIDFGAFRFELSRTQYVLKINKITEILEPSCIECIEEGGYKYHEIPSIHTTLIKIKYEL